MNKVAGDQIKIFAASHNLVMLGFVRSIQMSVVVSSFGKYFVLATFIYYWTPSNLTGQDFAAGLEAAQNGDFEVALQEWLPLAEDGNGLAQYNIGLMYAKGEGVLQDDTIAIEWYRRAADQGNISAQLNLGFMYLEGRGVAQDFEEAARWYRSAAAHGNISAQLKLGYMYRNGEGVPQDDLEAIRWYLRAAENGNAEAQYNAGAMYFEGAGVPVNYGEAARWYRRAAEQGLAVAQRGLGFMYDEGLGVLKSRQDAIQWYSLAANQGDVPAANRLNNLVDTIVPVVGIEQTLPEPEIKDDISDEGSIGDKLTNSRFEVPYLTGHVIFIFTLFLTSTIIVFFFRLRRIDAVISDIKVELNNFRLDSRIIPAALANAVNPTQEMSPSSAPAGVELTSGEEEISVREQPFPLDGALGKEKSAGSEETTVQYDDGVTEPSYPADIIQSLNFPDDEDDTRAFEALRRTAQDPVVRRLLQVSHNILILLSEDNIYTEKLQLSVSTAKAWRKFARCEIEHTAPLTLILDGEYDLNPVFDRFRNDQHFRSTVKEFSLLFHEFIRDFEKIASDEALIDLADTRTARSYIFLTYVESYVSV